MHTRAGHQGFGCNVVVPGPFLPKLIYSRHRLPERHLLSSILAGCGKCMVFAFGRAKTFEATRAGRRKAGHNLMAVKPCETVSMSMSEMPALACRSCRFGHDSDLVSPGMDAHTTRSTWREGYILGGFRASPQLDREVFRCRLL